jgi:apolipoprotein N-acyltransferase
VTPIARYGGDTLAFVAGLLMPLGFAPFGWYPLPLLGISLALHAWLIATPRRAAWRGWLFGLGMFGFGVGWVHVSIHQFGGNSLPTSFAITFALVAYLALYPALLAALLVRSWRSRRSAWRIVLLLAAGWVLLEWVRGWLLTGFPWLALGISQIDGPLSAFAPLGGGLAVGFLATLSSGLLWALFATPRIAGRLLALLVLAGLWGGAFAWGGRDWTAPAGEPFRVSLLQGNIGQSRKWLPEELGATLDLYRALHETSLASQLVIWPETAVPVFYENVADGYIDELQATSRLTATDVLLGIPYRDVASDRYYNSMLALTDAGRAFYRKRHLVPFGEFLPFRDLLGEALRFLHVPMADFDRGPADQAPLMLAGQPVGISICYEDVFSREVRSTLPEATLLVNVSNDAWFGDSIAPHQHLQIARMRALETGRMLLRGTNTGISAIIGPRGEVRARAPQFEVHALHGEVEPRRGATPYVALGDGPMLGLALLLALLALAGRPRPID